MLEAVPSLIQRLQAAEELIRKFMEVHQYGRLYEEARDLLSPPPKKGEEQR